MESTTFFVYILQCKQDLFYVGVTNDLQRRLQEHRSCINPKSFTSRNAPCNLVYSCGFSEIASAIAAEKRLKKWSRLKKQALIDGEFDLLTELSKKKF